MQRTPLFTIALLIALAITALWWQLAEKRARFEWKRAEAAATRVHALEDSLRAQSLRQLYPPPARSGLIQNEEIVTLKRLGLSDPYRQLPASLADHPELIPYPGVLGGTMAFHDLDDVILLAGRWVVAPFDDGHVLGYGLFEYQVTPGGHIHWKRVAARMD